MCSSSYGSSRWIHSLHRKSLRELPSHHCSLERLCLMQMTCLYSPCFLMIQLDYYCCSTLTQSQLQSAQSRRNLSRFQGRRSRCLPKKLPMNSLSPKRSCHSSSRNRRWSLHDLYLSSHSNLGNMDHEILYHHQHNFRTTFQQYYSEHT